MTGFVRSGHSSRTLIFASGLTALDLPGAPAPRAEGAGYADSASSRGLAAVDAKLFERLYDAHVAFVARSVRRLGVAEALLEDVVQEVFLVAFRRLPDFQGQSSMSTWLYGIALRVVRLHRRTNQRANLHGAIDRAATPPENAADRPAGRPDAAAETADAYRLLLKLLDQLDDDKREIFVLVELEQMRMPDVAELLGLKLNTAYSRLRLARAAFEAALQRARRCP